MEEFDQVLTPAEQAVLKDLETGFAANTADVLQTVINLPTEVTLEDQQLLEPEQLAELGEEMVVLPLTFTAGLSGGMAFFLSKEFTAKVVDFMIMGDGQVEFMPEEHLDGIVEALNQVLGGFYTELTGRLGQQVEASGEKAELIDSAKTGELYGGWVLIRFRVQIEGQEPFLLAKALSRETVEALVAQLQPAAEKPAENAEQPGETPPPPAPEVRDAQFSQFSDLPANRNDQPGTQLDLVMDIRLPIRIELGRTRMLVRDVVKLGNGSIIELNKLSGEPVDVFINEKKFARGEVVVIEENFGVRITEILRVEQRLEHLVEL
jgi:flagellar motor switch protein FliN/FliY